LLLPHAPSDNNHHLSTKKLFTQQKIKFLIFLVIFFLQIKKSTTKQYVFLVGTNSSHQNSQIKSCRTRNFGSIFVLWLPNVKAPK
jgi:hypothetical protein